MTETATIGSTAHLGKASHRLDIQGLRALAVLSVVAFHAGLPIPGGFVGVDVFFVVSGFVITAMLLREWDRTGRIGLLSFYRRRFFRLTPALSAVLVFVALVVALIGSPLGGQGIAATTALATLFLAANVAVDRLHNGYFGVSAQTNPLLHMWSLSVEEQFYLFFPLVLIVALVVLRKHGKSRQMAIVAVAAVSLTSFAATMWGASGQPVPGALNPLFGFYSPLTRVWEFGVGALFALVPAVSVAKSTATQLLRWGGLATLGASWFLISSSTVFPGLATLLPVLATGALIASGSQTPSTGILTTPLMVRIGDLSYSWYLWHWPFIVFAELAGGRALVWKVLAAVAALLVAGVSYRWVEQPLRRLGQEPFRRAWRPALVVSAAPLVAVALLTNIAQTHGSSARAHLMWQDISTAHIGRAHSCAVSRVFEPQPAQGCTFGAGLPGAPVFLVGDSHAIVFSDAVVRAASKVNRPVTVWTMDGCPPLDVVADSPGVPKVKQLRCRAYQAGVDAWLAKQSSGTVVLSIFQLFANEENLVLSRPGSSPATNLAGKQQVMREALAERLRTWRDKGLEVILIHDAPSIQWNPNLCTRWQVNGSGCTTTLPRTEAVAPLLPARAAWNAVATEVGAKLVDALPLACSETVCSNAAQGRLRYQDSNHLTVAASLGLVPQLEQKLGSGRR